MVSTDAPVIIVGAGPVGLTLALNLASRGVPCTILSKGQQSCEGSRAIALHRSSLETWQRLLCLPPILAEGVAWTTRRTFYGPREVHTLQLPDPGPSRLPTFINLPQSRLEDILIKAVTARPSLLDLRWRHEVVAASQDDNQVLLTVLTSDGVTRMAAPWVVACDGARSRMRAQLQVPFPGRTYNDRFLIVDVRANIDRPAEPCFYFHHPSNPGSTTLVHPQPDHVWRIDWQLGPYPSPAHEDSPEQLGHRISEVLGTDQHAVLWSSTYRFHQRLLHDLRHGRVLFAGDAAHLCAPFGARGLNSGIADVDRLGRLLAEVVHGRADEMLLNRYQATRWWRLADDQKAVTATMRFMAPGNVVQKLWQQAVLKSSTRWTYPRRWINSGSFCR